MVDKKFTILVVEDDPNDIILIKRAFHKAGVSNPVQTVCDGEEAVAYLTGNGPFSDRQAYPAPGIVFTDLKMPRMGGIELLRWLRNNPSYKVVPTLVLSSSMEPHDIQRAYFYGANSYVVKPANFEELQKVLRTIIDYWEVCRVALPDVFSGIGVSIIK